MIDLHSHILPGMDDGSASLAESISMARLAVNDGIQVMACTPHIVPGLYDNGYDKITSAVNLLSEALKRENIPLTLIVGADVHAAPDLVTKISDKQIPTLNNTRYFLFEPPHHVVPPRLEELVVRLITAGFCPILTHPERLSWIHTHFDVIARLNSRGCLMQVTAASLTGNFGKSARYFAERMLDEGRVDILATDSHNTKSRPPILSKARQLVEQRLGADEARRMVFDRPAMIVKDRPLTAVGADKKISNNDPEAASGISGLVGRLLRRREA